MRIPFLLFALLCLTGCHATFFAAVNATQPGSGIVAHRDIPFAPDRDLSLDVYAPLHAEHAPVVVYFYGGDWRFGQRGWYRWVGEALARRGVVAIVPDYRHWPAVRMDGFLRDGADAVRWAKDHAAMFGGDASDLFVMGHSSGGHIAAMLATDKQWLASVGMKPRDLSGLIGVAGAFDFLPLDEKAYLDMFGRTADEQARSQPVHFVDGDEPPALLLQGEADTEVYPAEAISLEGRYRQMGEPVELKLYPGLGHEKLVFALGPLHRAAPVMDDVMRFIHAQTAHRDGRYRDDGSVRP
ncbi:alpha/beta hydrolase [Luteibacter aegosomatis]|uniref:alpha/beta hydrolase n=1 Tax=Luteibacter aegosomatis TaxID=2911537 RepID=UPI001FF85519|nr:alpha/beta hydrolase [Luteibacter aegosomatis]UPG85025.1 alpha/beta hydrolase [Luteibacter aegosomatis]